MGRHCASSKRKSFGIPTSRALETAWRLIPRALATSVPRRSSCGLPSFGRSASCRPSDAPGFSTRPCRRAARIFGPHGLGCSGQQTDPLRLHAVSPVWRFVCSATVVPDQSDPSNAWRVDRLGSGCHPRALADVRHNSGGSSVVSLDSPWGQFPCSMNEARCLVPAFDGVDRA